MIKFSKPKEGETRYLAFQDHNKKHFWIQRVEMTYIGTRWYQGKIEKFIAGENEVSDPDKLLTGQYPYFCFLETESDAKRLLILNAFDTRVVPIFFREDDPGIEELI
jgi:hypothetical protein